MQSKIKGLNITEKYILNMKIQYLRWRALGFSLANDVRNNSLSFLLPALSFFTFLNLYKSYSIKLIFSKANAIKK